MMKVEHAVNHPLCVKGHFHLSLVLFFWQGLNMKITTLELACEVIKAV